ncbi:Z1 domain-containing protein [Kocuria rosea]|uniref:Z1 domain-containing protein n=1 Tax=Kocuria rosea TaxID=1275 RepID=UPI0011A7E3D0|nr:Z1 domain-containing protein [Kocuria rosea]
MLDTAHSVHFDNLFKTLSDLAEAQDLDLEALREAGHGLAPIILRSVDEKDRPAMVETVVNKVHQQIPIDLNTGTTIVAGPTEPWLDDLEESRSEGFERWKAYMSLLREQKRPPKVMKALEQDVRRVAELAGNPNVPGSWSYRGLVIGSVQSGKTSNYIGLLNMAADAGYRIVIAIGGHTEDLRRQTQKRVDEGFIGYDTRGGRARRKRIGVGLIKRTIPHPQPTTTYDRDFSSSFAEQLKVTLENQSTPTVFVIKKNAKVIDNLIAWLGEQTDQQQVFTEPLLVVDDESDYASVDTSKEEDDPTAVNKAIVKLLNTSTRNSYVGFTATPFANILTDPAQPKGLFPSDFIHELDTPNNYLGASTYFGDNTDLDAARTKVADAEKYFPFKHTKELPVTGLPDSLVRAMDTFLLANAIRDLRGEERTPRSMLINVSRFNDVQEKAHSLVATYVRETVDVIQAEIPTLQPGGKTSEVVERLHQAWEAEYPTSGFTWPDILAALPSAVEDLETELVNSKTEKQRRLAAKERRDRANRLPSGAYRPRRYIAVGGTILARGITLDGLTVSYFYQRSMLSDTLLQMGRWFGYRDGYRDLVRVWLDPEVKDWFAYIGETLEDIHEDLLDMHDEGRTPAEFGLKVRRHPESLRITAANKLRHTRDVPLDLELSLYSKAVATTRLPSSGPAVQANWENYLTVYEDLCRRSAPKRMRNGSLLWSGVPRGVVERYLNHFKAVTGDFHFGRPGGPGQLSPVSAFAADLPRAATEGWDVVFISGSGEEPAAGTGEPPVQASVRNQITWEKQQKAYKVANRRVAAAGDLRESVREARNWSEDGNEKAGDKPSERYVLRHMRRPVLMLYRFTANVDSEDDPRIRLQEHVTAAVVAFPGHPDGMAGEVGTKSPIVYTVNKIWIEENWGGADLDED